MPIQSEAALETGLIATLQQMDYEYVQIAEEKNLLTNFKRQLEIHNRKKLAEFGRSEFTADEFDKILASRRRRSSETFIRLTQRTANASG